VEIVFYAIAKKQFVAKDFFVGVRIG